ncbi:hypothetical protein JMJ58_03810 [Haloterrigena salifodinae]|uniref:Uncharacterized protein n=1 Tax=Haloterrigena salifodinae TaxID=2675099 RepID=A0A8T8E2E7_9EURY|nr:hypothetical protein [Haloterrigena salifodinae]QRV16035.1 hypothetical protein JMJ58_03810 [Haloterrigena salifodinae]
MFSKIKSRFGSNSSKVVTALAALALMATLAVGGVAAQDDTTDASDITVNVSDNGTAYEGTVELYDASDDSMVDTNTVDSDGSITFQDHASGDYYLATGDGATTSDNFTHDDSATQVNWDLSDNTLEVVEDSSSDDSTSDDSDSDADDDEASYLSPEGMNDAVGEYLPVGGIIGAFVVAVFFALFWIVAISIALYIRNLILG